MKGFASGLVVGIIVTLSSVIVVLAGSKGNGRLVEINQAIEQCEQTLPRNKHCEPVISAKIVEE